MDKQLKELIEEHRAAIVTADGKLDQIARDQQALQQQSEALQQRAAKLQQAQQAALREKVEARAALTALERLAGE